MSKPLPATALVVLCHRRWTVRLLAAIGVRGERFAVLTRQLGLARQSLRRQLDHAIERGWVARHAGYGHPLRPEYVLTRSGLCLREPAAEVAAHAASLGTDLVWRKWTLPVLAAIQGGASRFSDVERTLDRVTPRALASALDTLVEADLLEREVVGERPPWTRYRVAPRATALAEASESLAHVAAALEPRDEPPA